MSNTIFSLPCIFPKNASLHTKKKKPQAIHPCPLAAARGPTAIRRHNVKLGEKKLCFGLFKRPKDHKWTIHNKIFGMNRVSGHSRQFIYH